MLELVGSLYSGYFCSNTEGKIDIIKTIQMELFINNKKELQVTENPLFESSKMLNFGYGGAKQFDVGKFIGYLKKVKLEDLKCLFRIVKGST